MSQKQKTFNTLHLYHYGVAIMELSDLVSKHTGLEKEKVVETMRKPPQLEMGDLSFPCFSLAKIEKKSPKDIANKIAETFEKPKIIDKVESVNGYVNFYFNRGLFSEKVMRDIHEKESSYGTNKSGEGKNVVMEMSSPNIAKPFGIGHLRSTIIGEALSKIYKSNGYTATKINYLGDWGSQFGKMLYGFNRWGDQEKFKKDPINHLQDVYVKTNLEMTDEIKKESKKYFQLMEEGDEKTLNLWKDIRKKSLKEFDKIYDLLGVSFDITSGESLQNEGAEKITEKLIQDGIAKESEGAIIVDMKNEGKSVGILKKSDGTSTYLSRDLSAAIQRKKDYKFEKIMYEVGTEQSLHFDQLKSVLTKMGYDWADQIKHINHGLYLGKDGKKLSTRQGSSVKIEDIWNYTKEKVSNEIVKRGEPNPDPEKIKRITRSAIVYGDLKNHRESNIKYDLDSISSMEGDTGPYLLYSYARSNSILKKAKYEKPEKIVSEDPIEEEYQLISKFSEFPERVLESKSKDGPSIIAKYSMDLAKEFNTFYTKCNVLGSDREKYRLQIIDMYKSVLRNSLGLLGIDTIEEM